MDSEFFLLEYEIFKTIYKLSGTLSSKERMELALTDYESSLQLEKDVYNSTISEKQGG